MNLGKPASPYELPLVQGLDRPLTSEPRPYPSFRTQALTIAVTSLATKLDIMLTEEADQSLVARTAENMASAGYLVCFQGLVSTIGKEQVSGKGQQGWDKRGVGKAGQWFLGHTRKQGLVSTIGKSRSVASDGVSKACKVGQE